MPFRSIRSLKGLQKLLGAANFPKTYDIPCKFNAQHTSLRLMQHLSNECINERNKLTKRERQVRNATKINSLFTPLFKLKSAMSHKEWELFESDILEKKFHISNHNFEGVTMKQLCYGGCSFEVCQSFLEYIRNSRKQANIYTIAQFISFFAASPECDETMVLEMYEDIMSRVNIMDKNLSDFVVSAICHTHRWKESIKIAKEVSEVSELKYAVYGNISSTAFRNNEPALGWHYLLEPIKKYHTIPRQQDLVAVINWCERLVKKDVDESKNEMRKLLHLMYKTQITISSDVYNSLRSYFKSIPEEKWNLSMTHIASRSCNHCGHLMKSNEISNEECNELREQFIKDVTIGGDIFRKTTPQEMKQFIKFIGSQEPFDIIIDGLNVMYSRRGKMDSMELVWVIRHAADMGMKKVLVTGRKHILKQLPQTHIGYLHSIAQFFFSDNLSEDDPFALMAALLSGPQTKFVSNDMLKNHKFLLNFKAADLFSRWQQRNQFYYEIKKRSVCFKPTIEYLQTTQWSDDWSTLHIPFCKDLVQKVGTNKHNEWICIRKDV